MAGPTRDLVTAGAVALFAGAYLYLSRDLETGVVQSVPGPGAFPRLVGLGMLAVCGWLALRALLAAARGERAAAEEDRAAGPAGEAESRRRGRVLALYGLFVLYVVALPVAGFGLATVAFAVSAMAGVLGLRLRQSVAYAVVLTFFAEGLFRFGLDVPLPRGWFG